MKWDAFHELIMFTKTREGPEVLTADETWIYQFDPENKMYSKQ